MQGVRLSYLAPAADRIHRKGPMKYEAAKRDLQFHCEWAVYPVGGESSICYCTDKIRAEFIAKALEAFTESPHDPTERNR